MKRIKERVFERVIELVDRSFTTQGIIIPVPKIHYRLRSTDIAGIANLNCWEVGFNPTMLKRYEDEYIEQTVAHEIAHFVAVTGAKTMNIFPHGREWQHTMRCFDLPPKINHNYVV